MQKLTDKIALITGGGGGIGRATALSFAAEGAKVVVADINGAAAEEVAREIVASGSEAFSVAVDVSSADQVQAMIAQVITHFGRLDIAFNNAGIEIETEPLARASEEMFDKLMSVNVKGVFLCMKYEIQQMLAQEGGGAIVNTSSIAGQGAAPRQPIYGATKHAVIGLTKAAAVEYGRKGIRINAVCPGVIQTAMMDRAIERDPRRAAPVQQIHPIGRIGEPEEVARAVVFLSSEDARFILGHCLAVDGGYLAR